MLTHGTYKLPDSEFKTPRIRMNLKSAKIWPRENKALYSSQDWRSFAGTSSLKLVSHYTPQVIDNSLYKSLVIKLVSLYTTQVIDNSRYKSLEFKVKDAGVLHGFAGYFDTRLYGDVMLSILPATHSPGMFSWFPILFPVKVSSLSLRNGLFHSLCWTGLMQYLGASSLSLSNGLFHSLCWTWLIQYLGVKGLKR